MYCWHNTKHVFFLMATERATCDIKVKMLVTSRHSNAWPLKGKSLIYLWFVWSGLASQSERMPSSSCGNWEKAFLHQVLHQAHHSCSTILRLQEWLVEHIMEPPCPLTPTIQAAHVYLFPISSNVVVGAPIPLLFRLAVCAPRPGQRTKTSLFR